MSDFVMIDKLRNIPGLIFKGKTRTANAVRQTLYSFLLKGVSVLISFVYVPLLLNYLNSEKYGIWLTLVSVTNWVSVFDIGLGNGLRNKLTEALAKKDLKLGKIYVSTTYILFGCITIGLLIVFNIANRFIPWTSILNTKLIPTDELFLLTSIVISITILRFFAQLVGVVFQSYQMPSINNLIVTISSLISLIGVYLVYLFLPKGNITLLAAIITIAPVLTYFIFSLIAFGAKFKEVSPSVKFVDFSYSRVLFLLSAQFFVVQITALIIYSSENIIVANLFNPKEVIVYNVAMTIFNATIMVMAMCLSPIWSLVTDAYAIMDIDYLKKTLRRLNVLSVLFSIGVLIILFASHALYTFWLKGKVNVPFNMSLAMAVYAIIYMFQAPYSMYINGMGKMKVTSTLSILGIGVYFAGAVLFSRYFNSSIGVIMGISLSSLIGLVIQRFQVHLLLNNKAKGIWNK